MNWFFHKVYWTGWISHHNKRKKALTETPGVTAATAYRGLVLLGFTAVYREGFEVVLFLQSMRLRAGSHVVLAGVTVGLGLTAMVGFLTFVAHRRLPYKRMLVLTGVMLGGVLLVMVGEQVQEMQQANWVRTTTLNFSLPEWANVWFGVFPTVQSLGAQALGRRPGDRVLRRRPPHQADPAPGRGRPPAADPAVRRPRLRRRLSRPRPGLRRARVTRGRPPLTPTRSSPAAWN